MAVISQMTGMGFNYGDLEHVRNWLVERGLMATIDKENRHVVVCGTVNGEWKEDVNGNLFRVK